MGTFLKDEEFIESGTKVTTERSNGMSVGKI